MTDLTRPPPYAPDTRARGWRFEVDMEKVKQSDTWLRAKTGEVRGALMLLWGESWQQTPCGSLPADDELVALLIDMPPAKFTKFRPVLMRGWYLANDGRLYHETITERVLEMIAARTKERDRKNAWRQRQDASHPPVSHGTDAGRTDDSARKNDTGTSNTSTSSSSLRSEEHPPKPPRKRGGGAAAAATVGVERLVAEGVLEQHAKDWLTARKAKHLPLTLTAWEDVKAEAQLAGMSIGQAIHTAAIKGWGGFKAKWLAQEAADDAARGGDGQSTLWWESKSGLLDKGMHLQIPAPADEHPKAWLHFKAAVWVAAGEGPWWDKTSAAYPMAVRLRDEGGAVAAAIVAGLRKEPVHA